VVSALPDQMWDTLQLVVDEPSKLKLPEIAQQMSDMLQLVVELPNVQAPRYYSSECSIIRVMGRCAVSDNLNQHILNDKLKHIGHLVDAFLVA